MNDAAPLTALVGATLIDGNGGTPVPDSVVTMQGDRIVEVGTRRSVALGDDAVVVDLAGKFLLPGLIDVHVHYFEWMGRSVPRPRRHHGQGRRQRSRVDRLDA